MTTPAEASPFVYVRGDSLDAAWAEAEGALPAGAWLVIEGPHDYPYRDCYDVEARDWDASAIVVIARVTREPLLTALRALAAKLRERPAVSTPPRSGVRHDR